MKMAKASDADLDMATSLVSVLDDIEGGHFPFAFSDPDSEEVEWLDPFDHDQNARLHEGLRDLLKKGSIGRVIYGMAVVCDSTNECIDPDANTIEHHPKRQLLEQQRDELLAALEHILAGSLSLPRFAEAEAIAVIASVKGGA